VRERARERERGRDLGDRFDVPLSTFASIGGALEKQRCDDPRPHAWSMCAACRGLGIALM
jgi:hypothetical protein